jgi:hypothetical protein
MLGTLKLGIPCFKKHEPGHLITLETVVVGGRRVQMKIFLTCHTMK